MNFTLTLLIAAFGSFLAVQAELPLALLLGPMLATMAASLMGAPVVVPDRVRITFLTIIGAFLASKFTPDVAQGLSSWPISLAFVPVFVVLALMLAGIYYYKIARLDLKSAAFAALPGGLLTAVIIGGEFGGDKRNIAIAQALRVIATVYALVTGMWLLVDIDWSSSFSINPEAQLDYGELMILGILAAVAAFGAIRLRLPAPHLTGPLMVIAPFYLTGTLSVEPPRELLAIALLIMGATVGSQFKKYKLRDLLRMSLHTLFTVTLLFALAAAIAGCLSWLTGISFFSAFLAFAPGGITEISLIALALEMDPGYVAVHHLLRITLCILIAPWIGRWVTNKVAAKT